MRTFTVEGLEPEPVTYEGFNRDFNSQAMQHVAIVKVDGELDVYVVDDPGKLDGLRAYLAECAGVVELVGVFTRLILLRSGERCPVCGRSL